MVFEDGGTIKLIDIPTRNVRSVGEGIAPRVIPFSNHFVFLRETGRDLTDRIDRTVEAAKAVDWRVHELVIVPVANVPSYLTRTRGYLHEERWPIDMNRVFPGSRSGLLSQRIASVRVTPCAASW